MMALPCNHNSMLDSAYISNLQLTDRTDHLYLPRIPLEQRGERSPLSKAMRQFLQTLAEG